MSATNPQPKIHLKYLYAKRMPYFNKSWNVYTKIGRLRVNIGGSRVFIAERAPHAKFRVEREGKGGLLYDHVMYGFH